MQDMLLQCRCFSTLDDDEGAMEGEADAGRGKMDVDVGRQVGVEKNKKVLIFPNSPGLCFTQDLPFPR